MNHQCFVLRKFSAGYAGRIFSNAMNGYFFTGKEKVGSLATLGQRSDNKGQSFGE